MKLVAWQIVLSGSDVGGMADMKRNNGLGERWMAER
jgi:hypothetical protein